VSTSGCLSGGITCTSFAWRGRWRRGWPFMVRYLTTNGDRRVNSPKRACCRGRSQGRGSHIVHYSPRTAIDA